MKRKIAAIIIALVAVAGINVAVATPAQAAWSNCVQTGGDGAVGCMWSDVNGGGSMMYVYNSFGCKNVSSGWNDVISSVKGIYYGKYFRVWKNANCSGDSLTIHNGDQWSFGAFTPYWFMNDSISSYAIYNESWF